MESSSPDATMATLAAKVDSLANEFREGVATMKDEVSGIRTEITALRDALFERLDQMQATPGRHTDIHVAVEPQPAPQSEEPCRFKTASEALWVKLCIEGVCMRDRRWLPSLFFREPMMWKVDDVYRWVLEASNEASASVFRKNAVVGQELLQMDADMLKSSDFGMGLLSIKRLLCRIDQIKKSQEDLNCERFISQGIPEVIEVTGRVGDKDVINGMYYLMGVKHSGKHVWKKTLGCKHHFRWYPPTGEWFIDDKLPRVGIDDEAACWASGRGDVADPSQVHEVWDVLGADSDIFHPDPNVVVRVINTC